MHAGGPSFTERLGERRARHKERGRLFRIGFALAGLGVLLAGLAMLVLPGPGLLVTGAALTMLALEFAWAEALLAKVVRRIEAVRARARRDRAATPGAPERADRAAS